MKNTNILDVGKGLVVGVLITIILFWLRGCQTENPSVAKTIQTKEIKGKFEAVKPEQKPIQNQLPGIGKKIKKSNSNNEDEFLQGQIDELVFENERLIFEFNKASDSIQKLQYQKAIELKSFNHTFNDDKINITAEGIVRGEIQSIKLDYTIKPQTIELPTEKEVKFRLLAGGGFGIDKGLSQPIYKANVGFQTRNGNVYIGSAQRIGIQDYFLAELNLSLFTIKGKKK